MFVLTATCQSLHVLIPQTYHFKIIAPIFIYSQMKLVKIFYEIILVYNFISKLLVHTFAPTFPPIQKPSLLLPHAYILPHSSCFYIILLFDFFLLNWVYYQLLNFLPIVSPSFFPMVPPSSQHHVFSPRRPLLPLKVSRSVAEPGI